MNIKQNTKRLIKSYFGWFILPILNFIRYRIKLKQIHAQTNEFINIMHNIDETKQNVFYLGITNHSNLGDMAQHFCILKWIDENYPNANVIKLEADTVVCPRYQFIKLLKCYYRSDDVIIFQSGYTTQDLGGCHEEMHRLVIDSMPYAHILMMPQTIFFQHEENRIRTSKSYNEAGNMLFLARDAVSYEQAVRMFPNIKVKLYPDIVTSLIGVYDFKNKRNGICLCVRNDGEKFYSDDQLKKLKIQLESLSNVTIADTTIKVPYLKIRNNLNTFIKNEIQSFSKYKVTITDRYHGTIFSLAAGTPVIIIKTNDHKVITGADWFKGIYDDYVYVAKDLQDAFRICSLILNKDINHQLKPYFKGMYYDRLKQTFVENEIQ